MIRIALPNKGSLSEKAVQLVKAAGYRCKRSGRELSVMDEENRVEFVFLRPRDIAVYVSKGIVEIGITGRDLNQDCENPALEILPLGFGRSSFRYAVPNACTLDPKDFNGLRIACSYPLLVAKDLAKKGVKAEIVSLDGAVEISIQLGVADAIADVVESGQTLREAGLKVIGESIMHSEAIVIAKTDEMLKEPLIATFIKRINGLLLAKEYIMIEYDIPKDLLDAAVHLTPGVEAPTVAPLNDPNWVAVKSMIKRKGMNQKIDELADLGAKGVVVFDIHTCRL